MGKQKKSEIDTILEQLKISYSEDTRNDLEDTLLEPAEHEEDEELTAVLEKIFSDSLDTYDEVFTPDITSEFKNNDNSIADDIETAEKQNNTAEADDTSLEVFDQKPEAKEIESKTDLTDHSDVDLNKEDNIKTEEEMVDDVLKSMFHSDLPCYSCQAADNGVQSLDEESISSLEADTIVADNIEYEIKPTSISDHIDVQEDSIVDDLSIDDINHDSDVVIKDADSYESTYEKNDCDELIGEYTSIVGSISDDDEEILVDTSHAIVVDSNDYVTDELQQMLCELSFFKPENDIDFSIREDEPQIEELAQEDPESQPSEADNEISDKDISLLMKLGYESQINASGENAHAHKVIFDESKEYVPEMHKIAHGFTGKEFSHKDQVSSIQKKFKFDKIYILIQSIILTILAVSATVIDMLAVFSGLEFDFLVSANLILSLIALITMSQQIFAGIYAIFKFDINKYSLPALILLENIICNLILSVAVSNSLNITNNAVYFSVGGYVLLSMAITAWSEWLDCYRESGTFNFITSEDTRYVAEKRTSADIIFNESKRRRTAISNDLDSRYIIKRAKFISGFHRKNIEEKASNIKIVFIIGVLPAIAIILGIITSLINDSIVSGMMGVSYVLFLSLPLSSIISVSIVDFLNYIRLKRINSVFIGSEAVISTSKIKSIVFKDIDAVEITACTRINPNKKTENPQKWLNIAHRVFEALGGPLSQINSDGKNNYSNISHDVAINSITDNGIDLYFDSSMNILIGDRSYMQSHGIKVKTDVNLTGATRGVERAVIYMAFDKTPQIGFIVTSRVKKSFTKIIDLLSSNNINIEVKSYEPQLNEYFFETSNPESPVNVIKPQNYESAGASDVSDCGLVSSNSLDICRAIIYSKVIAEDHAKLQRKKKMQFAIGLLASLALVLLQCLPSRLRFIAILQSNITILFYLIALLMIIPDIVYLIKVLIRK